jgi:hypothetical protein
VASFDVTDLAALPATPRDAELAALRLGAGELESAVQHAADLLARGQIDASHPWLDALVLRRIKDLQGVESLAADDVLAPLLDIPASATVLRQLSSREGWGALTQLADTIEPDRVWDDPALIELEAMFIGCTVEERTRDWRRAARNGEVLLRQNPDVEQLSRRHEQWRRRRLAEIIARKSGSARPPVGRGRRPGSEGREASARRAELRSSFDSLAAAQRVEALRPRSPVARQLVSAHAAEHGISRSTAYRDWQRTKEG